MPMEEPKPILISALTAADALLHGFSTRVGGMSRCYRPSLPENQGDLNLGFTKDDDAANVAENRLRFLRSIQADGLERFGLLRQTHSTIIHTLHSADEAVTDFTQPAQTPGDALMTDVPGILLTVQIADCIPVLLFDPKRRVVAAIHAGWRGTVARIVEHTAGAMKLQYGSDPTNLIAAIGPGIGPASYAVSEDVRAEFESQFRYADELFSKAYGPQLHLDLWKANQRQLMDAGLSDTNIHVLGEDTAANTSRFFSHRAENGFTGRMMASIGLAK
jgi:YfiH family protein